VAGAGLVAIGFGLLLVRDIRRVSGHVAAPVRGAPAASAAGDPSTRVT
jgi:hypothetical protein